MALSRVGDPALAEDQVLTKCPDFAGRRYAFLLLLLFRGSLCYALLHQLWSCNAPSLPEPSPCTSGKHQLLRLCFSHPSLTQGWIFIPESSSTAGAQPASRAAPLPGQEAPSHLILNYIWCLGCNEASKGSVLRVGATQFSAVSLPLPSAGPHSAGLAPSVTGQNPGGSWFPARKLVLLGSCSRASWRGEVRSCRAAWPGKARGKG